MTNASMIAATIVCAVACLVLVGTEYKRAGTLRVVSKTIASLAFIAVGVFASRGHEHSASSPATWIIGGLIAGAVGDVALLGRSDRAFMAGLVAFLLGHIAYVVAIAQIVPPADWFGPLALVPVLAGGIALAWLWPHLGAMKVPVIVYVLTIVSMVVGALAVWHAALTAGAIVFFISDLAVARDKFVASGFTNRAWGLPCYYAGQLLIAWSLRG
jgi:uncharacterized membrane protein YhhN